MHCREKAGTGEKGTVSYQVIFLLRMKSNGTLLWNSETLPCLQVSVPNDKLHFCKKLCTKYNLQTLRDGQYQFTSLEWCFLVFSFWCFVPFLMKWWFLQILDLTLGVCFPCAALPNPKHPNLHTHVCVFICMYICMFNLASSF